MVKKTHSQIFDLGRRVSLGSEEVFNELGVEELSKTVVHQVSDTILLYRIRAGMTVSPADLLSTETRLQMKGISDESLGSLIDAATPSKSWKSPKSTVGPSE